LPDVFLRKEVIQRRFPYGYLVTTSPQSLTYVVGASFG